MFDDLAVVVELEDVHTRPVVITRPLLETVQHDVVAFGDDPLELNPLPWVLLRHASEVLDERLLAVRHAGIVLDVRIADVLMDGTLPWLCFSRDCS